MRRFLTKSSTLWILAVVQVAIGAGFFFIGDHFEFSLLDEVYSLDVVQAKLEALSSEQKRIHTITTATLDTMYPLAYGGMFVGLAWRFLGPAGSYAAIPGLAVIPIDLTENSVQILALNGVRDVLVYKSWLTPMKFGLFLTAAIIALIAVGVAVRRKFF